MEPLSVLLGIAGFGLGLAADRFATRWPEHDEEHPPGRPVDWRTAVTAIVGAVAFGLLPGRYASDPVALVVFGAWFVTLIIGLATDLDQRLLPDVLTLPVIPVALVYALSGSNPLVGDGPRARPDRRGGDPGRVVPPVDPVRRGGVWAGRRQAAGRVSASWSAEAGRSAA